MTRHTLLAAAALAAALAGGAGSAAAQSPGAWNWDAAPTTPDPDVLTVRSRQAAVGNLDAVTDQSRFRFDWNGNSTALPKVEGAATAVGNMQSIDTDRNLDVRGTQFAAGRIPGTPDGTAMTDAWVGGLGDGRFAVGTATAAAKADDVRNASVDIAATAAANLSVLSTSAPAGGSTSATVGLTQIGKMDSSAAALATGTRIDSRVAGAGIDTAMSRATASAFGNVSSITVRAGVPGN